MFKDLYLTPQEIQQLESATNFYFVGIKGVGMASLAQCLLDLGKNVSGADVEEEFVTDWLLKKTGIPVDTQFTHKLPDNAQVIIYSGAHGGSNNPLVIQARTKGLLCLTQAQALGWLFNQKRGLAVCGVGGKSTVSAMAAWILEELKHHPSFSVGVGEIIGLTRTGNYSTQSDIFIAEADEYANNTELISTSQNLIPRFAYLKPQVVICTNLQFDHPDVYKNLAHTQEVFFNFFQNIKPHGWLIYNQDDHHLSKLANQLLLIRPDIKTLSFGQNTQSTIQLTNLRFNQGMSQAMLKWGNTQFELVLKIPGAHNLMNATATVAGLFALGIKPNLTLKTITNFAGIGRRCQLIKKTTNHIYYDDYAHHPTEIAITLQAIKQWYPSLPILAIFQPHTVSRTKALTDEFALSFKQVDKLILLPIFTSAREKVDHQFTIENLKQALNLINPTLSTSVLNNLRSVADELKHLTQPHLIITLGAGDLYKLHELIEN